MEDGLGRNGPFHGAIPLTVFALILILSWEKTTERKKVMRIIHCITQFSEGWNTTLSGSQIWRICMTRASSKGDNVYFCAYVGSPSPDGPHIGLPTGCVFSAMMMAFTIGGKLYPPLRCLISNSFVAMEKYPEACARIAYFAASAWQFLRFACPRLGLELFRASHCQHYDGAVECGSLYACGRNLVVRAYSRRPPGSHLNIFRLPLKIVVVPRTYVTSALEA
jgi:MFS transporter, MFS domain-containing protein family, molybdate-anion transporter